MSENFDYFEQQKIMNGSTSPEDIIVNRENKELAGEGK